MVKIGYLFRHPTWSTNAIEKTSIAKLWVRRDEIDEFVPKLPGKLRREEEFPAN
jgi:hypothetical protein